MNAVEKLKKAQSTNRSVICLGLDLDPKKMPNEYSKSTKGMFDFASQIIDATQDRVCAYKPNLAFYENLGPEGLSLLRQVVKRIPETIPVILDAKRGDIGNTASYYAEALFDGLGADWVTVNPYMGYDSIRPFLERDSKGAFVLCLTSNPGHKDFQLLQVGDKPLYRIVAEKVAFWNKSDNLGLVIGATAPEQLRDLRQVAEDMPLLIPGVGAQGGSLEKAVSFGTANFTKTGVINVSRSVLYASRDNDFADRAVAELTKLNDVVNAMRPRGDQPAADVAAEVVEETPVVNDQQEPEMPPDVTPPEDSDRNPSESGSDQDYQSNS